MTTLMWEAVAADVDAVVGWARAVAPDGLVAREVYVSDDGRVVLVTHWRDDAAADAAAAALRPPPGTCAREPHAWRFRRVDP